jgi:hypothetical protein
MVSVFLALDKLGSEEEPQSIMNFHELITYQSRYQINKNSFECE